jgi:high affinity Mn2+ porin
LRLIHVFTFLCATTWVVVAQTAPAAPPGCVRRELTRPDSVFSGETKVAVGRTSGEEVSVEEDDPTSMFPHSNTSPFWISGQANIIFQTHPPFHALYSGPNSLSNAGEYKTSLVGTIYLGVQVPKTHKYTEFLLDIESAGGRGISQALGLAGFTNLDVVRNPNLGSKPYVARAEFHQIIPLSRKRVEVERGPLSLATELPERRFEFRIGRMSTVDSFDVNSVGSDSHLQFLNWTVDNDGAFDYAADTRGYTYGAVLEYDDRLWSARYGIMLMPTTANGINLDWALSRARGNNMEFTLNKGLLWKKPGAIRILSFVNYADMGSYEAAVADYLNHETPVPNIIATRKPGSVKYGFGFNTEQQVTTDLRAFARVGWNEGQHESFAYTEVDQTVAIGADYSGQRWGRKFDKIGAAFVSNAISKAHQTYLKDGGLGFLLGDGNLNYGRENIFEAYYTWHTYKGLYYSLDLQYITNPGYNRDRGPVIVPAVRMHIDF